MAMKKRLLHQLVLLLLVLAVIMAAVGAASGLGCLNVPQPVFESTVQSSLSDISAAVTLLSDQLGSILGDLLLSNAMNDCLELLDITNYQLSLALAASRTGKTNGTGQPAADLRTWLSAAFANQETCVGGFEGIGGIIAKDLIFAGIDQVSSSVRQALYMIADDNYNGPPKPVGGRRRRRRLMDQDDHDEGGLFPYWVSSEDRKLLQANTVPTPDVVVALDGSGDFTSIMDAVDAAPNHGSDIQRFVIYIKGGVYNEYIDIKKKKTNIMVYGDGMDVTIITGDHSNGGGWTTYRSATFAVTGAGFIARDITIENRAGAENHQAVALRSGSDLSAYFRCALRGYQDTLYTHSNRQFYRECVITGTVDFIFGDAAAIFQECTMLGRKGLEDQKNTVTAQGRRDPAESTGFCIQFCNISSADDQDQEYSSTPAPMYLGRPWKQYSRTVIMQSYLGIAVMPQGWLEWNGNNDSTLETLFYGEYMNSGPGAALGSRVQWPGYHVFNDSAQVTNFTVAQFLRGNLWLPQTGVTYTSGI
ncbi:hypothetical protein Dimus_002504 [Dionaea muscipula]